MTGHGRAPVKQPSPLMSIQLKPMLSLWEKPLCQPSLAPRHVIESSSLSRNSVCPLTRLRATSLPKSFVDPQVTSGCGGRTTSPPHMLCSSRGQSSRPHSCGSSADCDISSLLRASTSRDSAAREYPVQLKTEACSDPPLVEMQAGGKSQSSKDSQSSSSDSSIDSQPPKPTCSVKEPRFPKSIYVNGADLSEPDFSEDSMQSQFPRSQTSKEAQDPHKSETSKESRVPRSPLSKEEEHHTSQGVGYVSQPSQAVPVAVNNDVLEEEDWDLELIHVQAVPPDAGQLIHVQSLPLDAELEDTPTCLAENEPSMEDPPKTCLAGVDRWRTARERGAGGSRKDRVHTSAGGSSTPEPDSLLFVPLEHASQGMENRHSLESSTDTVELEESEVQSTPASGEAEYAESVCSLAVELNREGPDTNCSDSVGLLTSLSCNHQDAETRVTYFSKTRIVSQTTAYSQGFSEKAEARNQGSHLQVLSGCHQQPSEKSVLRRNRRVMCPRQDGPKDSDRVGNRQRSVVNRHLASGSADTVDRQRFSCESNDTHSGSSNKICLASGSGSEKVTQLVERDRLDHVTHNKSGEFCPVSQVPKEAQASTSRHRINSASGSQGEAQPDTSDSNTSQSRKKLTLMSEGYCTGKHFRYSVGTDEASDSKGRELHKCSGSNSTSSSHHPVDLQTGSGYVHREQVGPQTAPYQACRDPACSHARPVPVHSQPLPGQDGREPVSVRAVGEQPRREPVDPQNISDPAPREPGFAYSPVSDPTCSESVSSQAVPNEALDEPVHPHSSKSLPAACPSQFHGDAMHVDGLGRSHQREQLDPLAQSDLDTEVRTSSSSDCGVDILSQSDCDDLSTWAQGNCRTKVTVQGAPPYMYHLHEYESNEYWRKVYGGAYQNQPWYPPYAAESNDQSYYSPYPSEPGECWLQAPDPYYEHWYNAWLAYSMACYGYGFQGQEQGMGCSEEHQCQDSYCRAAFHPLQQSRPPSGPPSQPPSRPPSSLENPTHREVTPLYHEVSPIHPDKTSASHQDSMGDSSNANCSDDSEAIHIPCHTMQTVNSAQNLLDYVHKQTMEAAGKPDVSFELIVRMKNEGRAASGSPIQEEKTVQGSDFPETSDLNALSLKPDGSHASPRALAGEDCGTVVQPPEMLCRAAGGDYRAATQPCESSPRVTGVDCMPAAQLPECSPRALSGDDCRSAVQPPESSVHALHPFWRFRARLPLPGLLPRDFKQPGYMGDYHWPPQFPRPLMPVPLGRFPFCRIPAYPAAAYRPRSGTFTSASGRCLGLGRSAFSVCLCALFLGKFCFKIIHVCDFMCSNFFPLFWKCKIMVLTTFFVAYFIMHWFIDLVLAFYSFVLSFDC